MRFAAACSLAITLLLTARADAQATCVDSTGDMCLNRLAMARADGVVRDVFTTRDTPPRFAPQLTFASLVRGVNGCVGVTFDPRILSGYTCCVIGSAGCNCDPTSMAEDPAFGGDRCLGASDAPRGGNNPSFHANGLDWYWTQVVRTRADGSAVADGEPGSYYPWQARIYDLGGEANRVALFPITDHPPLPCEAFEYSVWLSNNPAATTIAPEDAPDPMQWNPARLIRAYTEGWTRNPLATQADAPRADLDAHLHDLTNGDALADALTTVWALPCGLSFRYVSIQGGNYGNPGPECAFHSQEDELDAVAGLNEDDTAICIDGDGDGHRAATCGGSDCDDADPEVHPGAFEPCDATRDLNCEPPTECPMGTLCDSTSGLCVTQCFEGGCADGFTCTASDICAEAACAARTEPCPDGTVCRAGACVAPCDGVVCPGDQTCVGGACIDPCDGVVCPAMQVCIAGRPGASTLCGPACTCTEISVPLCPAGTACDARMGSDTTGECVDPGCEVIDCGPGELCEGGACVDACMGVTCPLGRTCMLGECVIDLCASISCGPGRVCRDGDCFDACDGVSCDPGERCRMGACVPDPCAAIDCGPDARCVEGDCVANPADGGGLDGSASADAGLRERPVGGCDCRVGRGAAPPATYAVLAGLVFVLVLGARARRR